MAAAAPPILHTGCCLQLAPSPNKRYFNTPPTSRNLVIMTNKTSTLPDIIKSESIKDRNEHIIASLSSHTHTVVFLHGRGSDGEEFAEELADTPTSDGTTLFAKLPHVKWVFPCSQQLWSSAFQEDMPAWFEAHTLSDPAAKQELQVDGLRDSVGYIQEVMKREIAVLEGDARRIILGGISQGGAVGLWTVLCGGRVDDIGGFFAASTWLPFERNIRRVLKLDGKINDKDGTQNEDGKKYDGLVGEMMRPAEDGTYRMRMLLGHGVDDAYVDAGLGRQARDVLEDAGYKVEWKEYSGAEQEGHWFSTPNQMDDILEFIQQVFS